MPVLPLMPGSADQVATPMPGGPPGGAYPPAGAGPTSSGMGGDLASLFGVGGGPQPMGGVDPLQQAMGMFDQIAQLISDAARTFPATADMASQMMEILDQWMQQALVSTTPASSSMPGADMMM
jgi:hypothetical protein